ncbi:hypothetical protein Efla_005035 [Eimeria flavescens]
MSLAFGGTAERLAQQQQCLLKCLAIAALQIKHSLLLPVYARNKLLASEPAEAGCLSSLNIFASTYEYRNTKKQRRQRQENNQWLWVDQPEGGGGAAAREKGKSAQSLSVAVKGDEQRVLRKLAASAAVPSAGDKSGGGEEVSPASNLLLICQRHLRRLKGRNSATSAHVTRQEKAARVPQDRGGSPGEATRGGEEGPSKGASSADALSTVQLETLRPLRQLIALEQWHALMREGGGLSGVYRRLRDMAAHKQIKGVRLEGKKQEWIAAWTDNQRRERRRYFSIRQNGDEVALCMAVTTRAEALEAGARVRWATKSLRRPTCKGALSKGAPLTAG